MTENRRPDDEREAIRPSRSLLAVFLACAAVYLVLYGPTAGTATFLGDDWFHIEPIPRARIAHLFFGDWYLGYRNVGGFYRPLPRVLMQSARAVFGFWAPGCLAFSGLFHLLNCALVWVVAARLARRRAAAWSSALIFAAYPTHPEALLQVSTLADPMAACGCLLAMAGYLEARDTGRRRGWLLAAAGVLLGALSKESWIILPLLVVLVEAIYAERGSVGGGPGARKALGRIGIFVLAGVAYFVFRWYALGGIGGYGRELSLSSARATYDAVFRLLLFPWGEPGVSRDLVNVFSLAGAMVIVWALLNFPKLAAFGLGWMAIASLPVLTLVPRLNDGGRLVYMAAIGLSLYLGGVLDAIVAKARTPKTHRALGAVLAVGVGLPLLAAQQRNCADWRRSFRENRRLVGEMVEAARREPSARRFAILDWPRHFGASQSNRPETAAKALSILAGIEQERIDPCLAPDSPVGTLTFTVGKDLVLRRGRVEKAQRWEWSGEALAKWRPSGRARLVHTRSDGSLDYVFEDRGAGLACEELGGATGYYSVLVCYKPSRPEWGFVMWRSTSEHYDPQRMVVFHPLPRLGEDARVAAPGWLGDLEGLLFLPAVEGETITLRRIEVARFEIAPQGDGGGP